MSQLLTIVDSDNDAADGSDRFVDISPLRLDHDNHDGVVLMNPSIIDDSSTRDDSVSVSVSVDNNNNNNNNKALLYTIQQFQQAHDQQLPRFVARAPGRVNIIGEHIDYNGFGVLPMALQQSTFVACLGQSFICLTAGDDDDGNPQPPSPVVQLEMGSTSPGAEPRRYSYPLKTLLNVSAKASYASDPPFDNDPRDWSHYVLCAFFGVLEELSNTTSDNPNLQLQDQGNSTSHENNNNNNSHPWWVKALENQCLRLHIHGTIPQGAGVSSSSALVVSSALAFLTLIESKHASLQSITTTTTTTQDSMQLLTKTQIASLCARCERWVGTEGGGMDQAISLFAQPNSGRYIQFQPTFRHKTIPLPSGYSWVVCHSLEESHKREHAARYFNKRVVECKIACRILAQQVLDWKQHHRTSNYPTLLWELVSQSGLSLIELEKLVRSKMVEQCSRQELISLVLANDDNDNDDNVLDWGENNNNDNDNDDEQQLIMEQVAAELGIVRKAGIEVLQMADSFCIRNRLMHVLSETRRVQEFVALSCEASMMEYRGHETESVRFIAQSLGKLMTHSHYSCSRLYECSSLQVDKLQRVCIHAPGAVGSRMTGAGWGGCVISLVETQHVKAFCSDVRKGYYKTLHNNTTTMDESEYMFVTTPSQGSNVFDLQQQ